MSTPNNLPAELTSFVGREAQLGELRRLLHRARLITLTGPGGSGKTRLVLRLAAQSLDRYPGGVWLLDLSPIGDGSLVEHSLAAVCRIKEEPRRSMHELLAAGLGQDKTLLVLDGCEHLVDTCADLAETLLKACPKLTVITTSREPLGVTGEVIWRTPSLTTPRPEDAGRPELLMQSEAVRLFVDRAQLSRPDFELEPGDTATLAQICTRLEGIPLAIELAAGLSGVMALPELLERLKYRFRLLTGGSRTSLPRHQTLRQAVDWSLGLLSDKERALLTRLAVFSGGFDLASAEDVATGDPVEKDDVLALLGRLVNKSLVMSEPTHRHATRYRMLDTIREYALEKLQDSGEAIWRASHARHYIETVADLESQLRSPQQTAWIRWLEEEQANLRLAFEWCLSEDPPGAVKLAASLGRFWLIGSRLREGLENLDRAIELKTADERQHVKVLIFRSEITRRMGEVAAARRDAEESEALARRGGWSLELGRSLNVLGMISSHAGDLEAAKRRFEEVRAIAEKSGVKTQLCTSLNNIAMVESVLGDQIAASEHAERAAALCAEIGDRVMQASTLDTCGRIQMRLGHLEAASHRWVEALAMAREFGDISVMSDALDGLALVDEANGRYRRAAVLLGAATTQRSRTGAEPSPELVSEPAQMIERVKAKLGDAATEAALREGAAMSLDQAIGLALGTEPAARHDGAMPLTDREAEVARMIGTGLTNSEIGAKLHISTRTVDAHIEHIRNKLGLRTRAQIAVWAHDRLGQIAEVDQASTRPV